MSIAPNGHLFGQIPQPVHSFSSIMGFLSPAGFGLMHSSPSMLTGQTLAQRYPPHPTGLHLSFRTIAILGIELFRAVLFLKVPLKTTFLNPDAFLTLKRG